VSYVSALVLTSTLVSAPLKSAVTEKIAPSPATSGVTPATLTTTASPGATASAGSKAQSISSSPGVHSSPVPETTAPARAPSIAIDDGSSPEAVAVASPTLVTVTAYWGAGATTTLRPTAATPEIAIAGCGAVAALAAPAGANVMPVARTTTAVLRRDRQRTMRCPRSYAFPSNRRG
jgi:hypothetical protein